MDTATRERIRKGDYHNPGYSLPCPTCGKSDTLYEGGLDWYCLKCTKTFQTGDLSSRPKVGLLTLVKKTERGNYYNYEGKLIFLTYEEELWDLSVKSLRKYFEDSWPEKWIVLKELLSKEVAVVEGPVRNDYLIQDFGDLYFLTKADLLKLGTIQDATADKVLLAIANSKTRPLDKVLLSLGIRHVNRRWSKKLADKYKNIWTIGTLTWLELISNSGIGNSIADSMIDFFHQEINWKMIERLRFCGVDSLDGYLLDEHVSWPDETKMAYKDYITLVKTWKPVLTEVVVPKQDLVTGKIFMFTGRLNSMTRSQAQTSVESKGGISGVGLTKETDYLVVGDTGSREGTNKLMLAHMYGTKKLSEEEFLDLV